MTGTHSLRIAWTALVAAVLALAAIACAGSSPHLRAESAAVTATAGTADEAVAQAVQASGGTYAGDCAATRSPEDVGKVCSKFVDERDGVRAYLTGRTFSEFSTWVFVEQTTAGWRIAGTAEFDFTSTSLDIPWPR